MTGEAPLTRREARELERAREAAESAAPARRAGTAEPTAGGEQPVLVTPEPAPAIEERDAVLAAAPSSYAGEAAPTQAPRTGSAPARDVPRFEAAADEAADDDLAVYEPAVDEAAAQDAVADPLETPAGSEWAEVAESESPEPSFRPRSHETAASRRAAQAPADELASGDTDPDGVPSRTLTRRELRAMLATQALQTIPDAHRSDDSAIAIVQESTPVEPQQADSGRRVTWSPPVDEAPAAAPEFHAPAPANRPETSATADADSAVGEDLAAPSASEASRGTEDSATAWAAGLPPQQSNRARGHWSVDADLEDVSTGPQSFDQLLSRGSASGGVPTTTSALILPVIPNNGEGIVSLNTGEILVTGSFDLPRSLGATGAHPDRIDSSDIDHYFDADDADESTITSAQPIRASRAVSTHASTRDVLTPPQKQSRWSVPFVLSISGGVLIVGVVGLVVAGFVSGVF